MPMIRFTPLETARTRPAASVRARFAFHGLGRTLSLIILIAGALACTDAAPGSECGPSTATVARVIDGDTIELESGERVRYLMIDTPESTTETECYGPEAKQLNELLVAGKQITLRYDEQCTDDYDRLLAYIELSGQEINRVMLERGYACVLHISPNGDDVVDEYDAIEYEARMLDKGLWGACEPLPCG
jgi:micrococcal nuclease